MNSNDVWMNSNDVWARAAECEQAIQETVDPLRRTGLTHLRELWIALANESQCLEPDTLAVEYKEIAALHLEVDGSGGDAKAS
jgi:hypothetical protein